MHAELVEFEERHKKEVMVMKKGYIHRKRSIVMPVLIGSAVGAGIALLLAPRTGKEIRNDLKRLADEHAGPGCRRDR